MWPQNFDGYGNHPFDYQGNLINSSNANIYSNPSSIIKQSPHSSPHFIAHSPISEDESSAKRKRKSQRNNRKVEIEKKRRDRINLCLDELRKLVPAANEKQGSAKLEKAEILQLTVDHLKQINYKGFDTLSFDPHNFATKHLVFGFKECAQEVNRYLTSIENCGLNNDSKQRLFNHLQHYIAKRECELKSNNSNGLAWNPNLFLIPSTTTTTSNHSNSFSNSTTNSLVNTTNAQQLLNSTSNHSPITTLTPSTLSNHSNSSIASNSSSYHQQVNNNQQNDHSTPTSPLSESPVANNNNNNNNNSSLNGSSLNSSSLNGSSLNSSQLTASQLLSQHSYIDNNNNTSNSSNNSLHSDSSSSNNNNSNNNSSNQTSNSINDDNGRNNSNNSNNLLTNQLISRQVSNNLSNNLSNIMGPPPPLLQKVNTLNGISSHSPNTSELTYTNMHPCSNTTAYSAHHHHSIGTNGYSTNSLPNFNVASIQHSNHHNYNPYFNSALAYGAVGQMSANASVVANVVSLPNSSVSHSATNQVYSNSAISPYCHRPWGTGTLA